MLSVNERINRIRDALVSIESLPDVVHYWRPISSVPFCIWAEEGEDGSLQGDSRKLEQSITGTVDYFTKTESDPNVDAIQDALNAVDTCAWELFAVQYEEDTNLIHYTWNWSVA